MGDRAKIAVSVLRKNDLLEEKTVIISRHLGLQSMNRWMSGEGKTLEEKLSILGEQILKGLENA